MKYKDLQYKPSRRPATSSNTKSILIKSLIGVFSLAVIFFGIKLIFTPVVDAVAGILDESNTSISFLLNGEDIKQDDGITNILLLGVDTRTQGGTTLTDTIIIGSLRHTDDKITLLSLPRDLWVDVPGFGSIADHSTKINSVYSLAEQYNHPEGGVALLQEIISNHLDIPLHYYAKVDFNGFATFVDAVDGVEIYVEQAFTDYQYPKTGYESAPWSERWQVVSFEQGWQHMDGETALQYARSRHALGPEGSDFARARRQQKVILALKEKITSSETLFNLSKIKELYATYSDEVETDIGLAEVPAFYQTAQNITDFSNIDTFVLTNEGSTDEGLLYTPDPNNFGGAFVLIPRNGWEAVQEFVSSVLYHSPTPTEAETEVEQAAEL